MSEAAKPFGAWERMIAMRYLRTRRENGGITLISIISFFGIMLAVSVLIIVMSVMNGFRTELLDRILGVNGHVYVDTRSMPTGLVNNIQTEARKIQGMKTIYPLVQGQVLAVGAQGFAARGGMVMGMQRDDFLALKMVSQKIVSGSLANWGKGEFGGDEVAIGSMLATDLGLMAGDYINLLTPEGAQTPFGIVPRSKEYKVGAIFDIGMSEYDKLLIYMPLEQSQAFLGRGETIDMLEGRVEKPDNMGSIIDQVGVLAGSTLVSDWKEHSASLVSALGTERAVMRLILLLLIVIAALNIISGLVMLVKNKGRDIAVLRTMGVTRAAITRIFIMIGASIGVLGTICGIIFGTLFCVNIENIQKAVEAVFGPVFPAEVYFLSQIPAHVEWNEVWITSGFALIMSILVTLPPAIRAAKLDPVEALRYE